VLLIFYLIFEQVSQYPHGGAILRLIMPLCYVCMTSLVSYKSMILKLSCCSCKLFVFYTVLIVYTAVCRSSKLLNRCVIVCYCYVAELLRYLSAHLAEH